MLNARFVPIEQWPGTPTPSWRRKNATFRATYIQTLDLLEDELQKLKAKEILIQAYFTRDQLRNDSWPKTNASPRDVGVILSFDSPKGPLSFPCDNFTAFDDNLRAIGLALQALRAVDRYGVTKGNEQYKGWAQIAPPSDIPKPGDAAVLFEQLSGIAAADIFHSPDQFQAAYRLAVKKAHPDAPGGSNEAFLKLSRAKESLEKHHAHSSL
jgi:hypothetical protein